MGHLLVKIATGPENPTRAALGCLVARQALADGHSVDVFFAGDGVDLLRPETAELAQGIGTGRIAEHIAALTAGGARLFASGMSSKARGIDATIAGPAVTFALPERLVELVFEAERVLVY
jgi:predicted peroxiredoxin